jgi:hypothetical protein
MTNESEKKLGLPEVDTKAGRDDLTLWSVTTIIGILDKPALMYWAAEQAANAAIASVDVLRQRIDVEGEESVRKWLRDARFRNQKGQMSAADTGTLFHSLAEEYSLSGLPPTIDRIEYGVADILGQFANVDDINVEADLVRRMVEQYDGWLQRFTPEILASEVAVYSPQMGYAGTCDSFMSVEKVPLITDFKTSRKSIDSRGKPKTPYPQIGLQLSAYRYAENAAVWRPRRTEKFNRRYYLLSPEEQAMAVPVPEVDGGLGIMVTPDSCEAYRVECGEETFKVFRHLVQVFVWNDQSRNVVGPMLESSKES